MSEPLTKDQRVHVAEACFEALEAYLQGRADERAGIVAWLRGAAKDELEVDGVGFVATEAVLEAVARYIR